MKTLGLLLVFAASLTLAAEAPRPLHPAPQRAKTACTDALSAQIQADTNVAFQMRSDAFNDGLERGLAFGAGGVLLVVGLAFRAKKFQPADPSSQKPLSRAASA